MANDPVTPASIASAAAASASSPPVRPVPNEITIYSHSYLLYWWPVWAFGLLFAFITWMEGDRMVIVPNDHTIVERPDGKGAFEAVITIPTKTDKMPFEPLAVEAKAEGGVAHSRVRMSALQWMGPLYVMVLLLVILITNIPLRGLWSLVVVISAIVVGLLFSLLGWWGPILNALGGLQVHINLAGYLLISTVLLIFWAVAVFIFDRRAYAVFSPGQVRICEEVGDREHVYDTMGMSLEKKRSDWFRHVILGLGTGDLVIRTSGADRHEIEFENVWGITSRVHMIEQLTKSRGMTAAPVQPA